MLRNIISKNAVNVQKYLTCIHNLSTTSSINKEQMIDDMNLDNTIDIQIPEYKERIGETLDIKKARLMYQSRKRGMLENGLVLGTFASRYLKNMDEKQTDEYDLLINKPSNDWDLFYWVVGAQPTPPEYENSVMQLLKEHVKNTEKEARNKQPDLY